MFKKISRRRLVILLTVGALLAFTAYATAASFVAAPPLTGVLCLPGGPTFELEANSGYSIFPDGNSLLMWSYAPDTSGGVDAFQLPGPVLCVTQGDTVTVNLTNNLPEAVSIVFPGQTGVTATGGSPGLFTSEAAAGGGTVSYSFVAGEPGTYLYESGTNPHRQVQMGLYGALVVRPTTGANFAYNDAATRFDPDREYVLVLHAIDPDLHRAVERGTPYDATVYHARYWTINGRSFPDTIAANNAPWLPGQPYGALVQVEASALTDTCPPACPALIRYANASQDNHPFHPHGNHLRVIARDGRLLRGPGGEDTSKEAFTKTIGSGQTMDLLFRWVDVEPWTQTGPLPTGVEPYPGLLNLVFKDDLTWYSGSPLLGQQEDFPPSTTILNECGEFYFPWHSHALNEFQNFDEGFGGLATLLRVDPPGGC